MKKTVSVIISLLCLAMLVSTCFIPVSAATETKIIYEQNFSTAKNPAEAGFETQDTRSGGATAFKGTMTVEDGALHITTEAGSTKLYWFSFVPAATVKNYNNYTISYDVYSRNGGVATAGTDWAIGMAFEWDTATSGTYTTFQYAGPAFNLAFGSSSTADGWVRAKGTYRFDMADKGVTTGLSTASANVVHHIVNTIDRTGKVMSHTVDGKLLEENVPVTATYESPISLLVYGKNIDLVVDNIKVTSEVTVTGTTEAPVVTTAPGADTGKTPPAGNPDTSDNGVAFASVMVILGVISAAVAVAGFKIRAK